MKRNHRLRSVKRNDNSCQYRCFSFKTLVLIVSGIFAIDIWPSSIFLALLRDLNLTHWTSCICQSLAALSISAVYLFETDICFDCDMILIDMFWFLQQRTSVIACGACWIRQWSAVGWFTLSRTFDYWSNWVDPATKIQCIDGLCRIVFLYFSTLYRLLFL